VTQLGIGKLGLLGLLR